MKDEVLIDTMMVHKFSADAITELLVEMNQVRDESRTWEALHAEAELAQAFMSQDLWI